MSSTVNIRQGREGGVEEWGIIGQTNLFCVLHGNGNIALFWGGS